jgi:hypothetical protein
MPSPSAWRALRICLTALSLPMLAPRAGAIVREHAFELGAGASFSVFEAHRAAYGQAPNLGAGYAGRLGDGDTWLVLEAGVAYATGSEFLRDPTFEVEDDARYWLVPVAVGLRTNLGPLARRDRFRLYGGISGLSLVTRWRGYGRQVDAAVFGLQLDLRPELPLGERWSVWARGRLWLVEDAKDPERQYQLGYSNTGVQIGVSHVMR